MGVEQQTLNDLDHSIAIVDTNSRNWQFALNNAIENLPTSAQSTIRNELTNLSTRTVAAAGEAFRCQVDFLGQRVKDGLQRIRAHFLHQPYPDPTPTLCDLTPSFVDMSLPAARRSHVDLSGYDFDSNPALTVWLASATRAIDVTPNLSRQTHYHETLNLGANGVQITPQDDRLIFRWQNKDIAYLPIIQSSPPACQSQPFLTPPVVKTYVPPHIGGDADFFGNADISIAVTLLPQPKEIDGTIALTAIEPGGDHTTAQGVSAPFQVYAAPAGKKITQVLTKLTDSLSYHTTTSEVDTFEGGGGAVEKYEVWGDHYGAEAGTWTRTNVYFNALSIQLVDTENCR